MSTISISTPIAGDNILQFSERSSPLVISGTKSGDYTDIRLQLYINNTQVFANVFYDQFIDGFTGTTWSISIPASDLTSLPGGVLTVLATPIGGTTETYTSQTFTSIAAVQINPIYTTDVIDAANHNSAAVITGTVGVAAGNVTVTLNGQTYSSVVSAGTWSITATAAAVAALANGTTYPVVASISYEDASYTDTVGLLVDTVIPAAPSSLYLPLASDSGTPADDITNVILPHLAVQAADGATVNVYEGSTLVGTGIANIYSGLASVLLTTNLVSGTNTFTAKQVVDGNVSAASTSLTVTYVATPSGLALTPGSDSGVVGDGITNVALPTITGTAGANVAVVLYEGAAVIGTGTSDGSGHFSITVTAALTPGVNTLRAYALVSGNYSVATPNFLITLVVPPTVTAGATASFADGGGAIVLDPGLTVAATSTTTLASATVTIAHGLQTGDTLSFTNDGSTEGNITAAYTGGVLTLTSVGATATVAQFQQALDSVTYNFSPSNGDPTAGGTDTSRTISWAVNDGTASSTAVTSTLNMSSANLLFTSTDGSTLYAFNGTTVTQLATNLSTPAFVHDPLLHQPISAVVAGGLAYFTMADSTGTTSAIWSYDGTTVTQVTRSANYVDTTQDSNNPSGLAPMAAFGNDLVFSQANLATNHDGSLYDHATLAVYNPSNAQITQPATPNGGYDPHDFVTLNGTLYFEATDTTTSAPAIYAFDGTTVTEVYSLHPTYTFTIESDPPVTYPPVAGAGAVDGSLAVFNNSIYFGSGGETVYQLTGNNTATNVSGGPTTGAEYDDNSPSIDPIVSGSDLYWVSFNTGVWSLSTSSLSTSNPINPRNIVGSIGSQSFVPVDNAGTLYFVSGNYSPTILNNGTEVNPSGSGASTLFTSTGAVANSQVANFSGSDFILMDNTLYYDNNSSTLGKIAGTATVGTIAVPSADAQGGQPLVVIPFPAMAWDAAIVGPVVVAGATAGYIALAAPVTLDAGLTLTDGASTTLASATVTIASPVSGDTLGFNNTSIATEGNIAGGYAAGVLTLTSSGATATLAQFQQALDSITYVSTNSDPTAGNTSTSRTVSWIVNDGTNSSPAVTSTITVHTPPVVTAGATVTFLGGSGSVILDSSLSTSDVDSATLTGATVSIANFLSGDALGFTSQNGITGNYNPSTGVLGLSGSASVANYQTALDSITYGFTPANGDPTGGGSHTSRTIDWVVNDGVASSAAVTSTVQTTHVAPTVSPSGTASFIVGGSAVAVDPGFLLGDLDSGGRLSSATVSVSGGTFASDGDVLTAVATSPAMIASYDAGTETLTVTGSDTLANYQTALQSVTYVSTAADPTNGGLNLSRTVSWSVNDGVSTSAVGTNTVAISFPPPVITGVASNQPITDETTTTPFSAVTITDPNGAQTETVTVTLSNPLNGGLSILNGGTYVAATGVYTVTGTPAAVTTALQGLVFTPKAHQVAPSDTTTTTFALDVTDSLAATSSNGATSVAATAVADPPVIAGTVANQPLSDAGTTTPFSGVSISDADIGQTETVTVHMDPQNGQDGMLSNLGDGSYDPTTGDYTVIGTDGTVTAELQALVFTPTPHQVVPGSSVTTTFTIQATDTAGAVSAADATTSVIATAANDPPVISGTVADQPLSDAGTTTPFSGVSISDVDLDIGQTETVTVTLSDASNGVLSNLGDGSYDSSTGVYSLTGSYADVNAALRALVFTPTAHQVAPNDTVTTTFTIQATDTAGAVSGGNDTTSVIATAATDTPAIANLPEGYEATTDEVPLALLGTAVISNVDFGQTETVVVTNFATANGSLSDRVAGSYDSTTGIYTVTGTDAEVTAAIDALVFTPTAHQVAPGDTVTTGFTLSVTDTAGAVQDAEVGIIVTAVNDPPVISLPDVNAGVPNQIGSHPFATMTIIDPDVGHTDTVTVTLSDATAGLLSSQGGGLYDAVTGIYTINGTAEAVTAALQGLVFVPTPPANGYVTTTGFTVAVTGPAGSFDSNYLRFCHN